VIRQLVSTSAGGSDDADAYSALSGGPIDADGDADDVPELPPPALRGPPGRSLSGRLHMLPGALGAASPAHSWVSRWAANPFARESSAATGGGAALCTVSPAADLHLPPAGGSPPAGASPPSDGGTEFYSQAAWGSRAGSVANAPSPARRPPQSP